MNQQHSRSVEDGNDIHEIKQAVNGKIYRILIRLNILISKSKPITIPLNTVFIG